MGFAVTVRLEGPQAVLNVRGDLDTFSALELGAVFDAAIATGCHSRKGVSTMRTLNSPTRRLGRDGSLAIRILDHTTPAIVALSGETH